MSLPMLPTRDGYGHALVELGAKNPNVVVLDADLAKSTRSDWFQAKYPERFFDIGISEQDLIGTAAGLSLGGKIPFATTYGVFVTGRAWDQIRTTVCYSDLNVKIAGAHGGISAAGDGAIQRTAGGVRDRRCAGEPVPQPRVRQRLTGLAGDHGDGVDRAGLGAETAAVTFFLIYSDYFA